MGGGRRTHELSPCPRPILIVNVNELLYALERLHS